MIALFFIGLLALLLLGMPIAISLGMSTLLYMLAATPLPLIVIPQRMFTTTDSFPLMAIPFFVLAGALMESSGISEKLIKFVNTLVGHVTGGLAIVVIITSAFFAAISGSSAATVSAIGAILIPAMIRQGYHKNFSAAVQCCSGQLGIIIPPSIAMVLYGVATESSIGKLFTAGILPGIFMAAMLCITAYIMCKRRGYKGVEKATARQRLHAFREAILALLMPAIVLGGIYSGLFTPTEAAGVAVIYSYIVGKFAYKRLDFKKTVDLLIEAAITTSVIMILIAFAGAFAWLLGRLRIPAEVAMWITSIAANKYIFLFLVNIFLFIVGMFMDAAPALMILAPLLAPIAAQYGVDLIHFGLIMVVNLAVGLCTPPVGVNIYLSCRIAGTSMEYILKDVFVFLAVLIGVVMVITYVPFLSLALL